MTALLLSVALTGCDRAASESPGTREEANRASIPAEQADLPVESNKDAEPKKKAGPGGSQPLRIVVMDPLAEPLSCACVDGLGQRRYDHLGEFLSARLDRPVEVIFEESLGLAYNRAGRDVDLVIGKRAMVLFDAKQTNTPLRPIAQLSDPDGSTEMTGLFVVRSGNPAKSVADLKGRRIMLGPVEDEETNAAAIRLLDEVGIRETSDVETAGSIEAAVFAVTDDEAAAAVISRYMPPLLEACGKVEPGSLRAIGETAAVPFIEVFATAHVAVSQEQEIVEALRAVADDKTLLTVLESKRGFVSLGWPDWRGPRRDGISRYLPKSLPNEPKLLWSAEVTGPALAGIVATESYVVVADKDRELTTDIFRCFDARTGTALWTLEYEAEQSLEYTNAPRAAPVIHDGLVYLHGALGDLHCVELATGEIVWEKNIVIDFDAELLNWGTSSPPLVVDDKLIINPGAEEASLVAVDRKTGEVIWKTPGHAAAYSALIAGTFGGVRQIVGYDVAGLAGWDIQTGRRLWEVIPPGQSDFNVGTPVIVDGGILVATENNATRLYEFDESGTLKSEPVQENQDLAPDTCSPVVVRGRVFCTAYGELFCLDLKSGLKTVWNVADDMYFDHTNLIGGNDRVLIWNSAGDLVLIRADGDKYAVVSHLRPFAGNDVESMSQPALVGDRLYLRDSKQLKCLQLSNP